MQVLVLWALTSQAHAAYLWVSKFPADMPHLAGQYLKDVIEQIGVLFGEPTRDLDCLAAEMIGTRDILREATEIALKKFGMNEVQLHDLRPYLEWKPTLPPTLGAKQANK